MDLTNITTPFGLLDAETQAALKAHGGPYEYYGPVGWENFDRPSWSTNYTYRVRPEPLRPLSVRWEHIPTWAEWAAPDKNGAIYIFSCAPSVAPLVPSWINSLGRSQYLSEWHGLSDPGTVDWRDSLIKRPEGA